MQIKVSDIVEVSSLPTENINTHKIYWDIIARKFYKSNNGTDWVLLGPVDFNYIDSLGFITIDDIPEVSLEGYATQTWVNEQGFLKAIDLAPYATQEWVNGQNFLQSDDLTNYVTNNSLTTLLENYVLNSELSDYATINWVNGQNYLQTNDLNGYATQDWTSQQGFLKEDALSSYATQNYVQEQTQAKRATVTISTTDWAPYSTASMRAVKAVSGINLGAEGTHFEVIPDIQDYANYEAAENIMNVYDHVWRWSADSADTLTAIYWMEDGASPSVNLTVEVVIS